MRLEAVFVAADNPVEAGNAISTALGLPDAKPNADGQAELSGLGAFVAVEPVSSIAPAGAVTLWIRVDDVPAAVEAFAAGGAVILQEPETAGTDTVATVVTAAGIRLGFIG